MPAPEKPATTPSLPGKLAKRTDGGVASKQAVRYASGMAYGEGQDFLDIQSSAAMSKSEPVRPGSMPTATASAATAPGPNVIPLTAPSQDLSQPVTHGADAGAGPGTDSLGLNTANTVADQAFQQQLASYMPVLMYIASRPDTSPETRNVIRQLREKM